MDFRVKTSVFRKLFGQDIPIIQSPMAGGITTPELIAAVSNAGALGSLGAGYMTPQEMRTAIKKIKALTNRPFSVNLFVPERTDSSGDFSSIMELLSSIWKELSNEPFQLIFPNPPSFEDQIQVILEEKVSIFSFTFGIPSSTILDRCKNQGMRLCGTATTPEEAEQLEFVGVDAIVCQGQEAGGHRGNFSANDPLYGLLPLLALTKEKVKVPLIAAGGIMDGYSASAALLAGACAVQLGTAFLTTDESGASLAYKEALLRHPHSTTALTRVFTGKWARAISNFFMEKLSGHDIPPYPLQHFFTKKLRSLAAENHRTEFMSLWAGQGYPLCRQVSATALIHQIVQELEQCTHRPL